MQASLVASTAMFAITRGISMERITAATGLNPEHLVDPEARVSQHIVPALWRLIAEVCPGQAVALDMARAAPFSFFGPLAHGARYAQDLHAVLRIMVHYRFVLSDMLHLALTEAPPEAQLQVAHPMDAEDGGYGAEVGVALGARFIREAVGVENALIRVEFTHRPFGPESDYTEFFQVPVRFECPINALVFHHHALDWPAPQRDPQMFRYIERHFELARERVLQSGAVPSDIARIHAAIAHNAERAEYGAEAVAKQLGMSLRALQRLVRTHGTTVRALVDQTRAANARELLRDPRLSVEQVAFLLGYSEDRAFRRACKRWTGKSPAELRRSSA